MYLPKSKSYISTYFYHFRFDCFAVLCMMISFVMYKLFVYFLLKTFSIWVSGIILNDFWNGRKYSIEFLSKNKT